MIRRITIMVHHLAPVEGVVVGHSWPSRQAVVVAGLPDDLTPHELRHTAASLLIAHGDLARLAARPVWSDACAEQFGLGKQPFTTATGPPDSGANAR